MTEETDSERLERVARYINATFGGDERADFNFVVGLARRGLSAGEPVAWQVKDYADGWITHSNLAGAPRCAERNAKRMAKEMGALLRPLYTVAPGYREGVLRAAGIADAIPNKLIPVGSMHARGLRGSDVAEVIRAEADDLAPQPIPPEGLAAAQAALDRMATRAPVPEAERIERVAKEFAKLGSDREQFGTNTPRVVDQADGTSEFMLEDVPVYWRTTSWGEIANANDDKRFVGARWPTRELPAQQRDDPVLLQPLDHTTPEAQRAFNLKESDAPQTAAAAQGPIIDRSVRPPSGTPHYLTQEAYDAQMVQLDGLLVDWNERSAAPPAPVPAGEVADIQERILAEYKFPLFAEQNLVREVVRKTLGFTAARPSADAGEVTEADELAEWIFLRYVKAKPLEAAPFAEMRDKLRAALATRGGRS